MNFRLVNLFFVSLKKREVVDMGAQTVCLGLLAWVYTTSIHELQHNSAGCMHSFDRVFFVLLFYGPWACTTQSGWLGFLITTAYILIDYFPLDILPRCESISE